MSVYERSQTGALTALQAVPHESSSNECLYERSQTGALTALQAVPHESSSNEC